MNDLPADAHELISLHAPLPLFITNEENSDGWEDTGGRLEVVVAVEPE